MEDNRMTLFERVRMQYHFLTFWYHLETISQLRQVNRTQQQASTYPQVPLDARAMPPAYGLDGPGSGPYC